MGENDTPQPNEPASPSDREGDRTQAEVPSEREKTTEVPWWYRTNRRGAPLQGDSSLRQTPPYDPPHLDPQPSGPPPTPHHPPPEVNYHAAPFDPSPYDREPLREDPYPRYRQQPDRAVTWPIRRTSYARGP
jgi:hypothetical protein